MSAKEEVAAHIHFKDGKGVKREFQNVPIGEGDLDMERILGIIRDSGYRAPLCAQYEGPDQPGVYKRDIAWIRERVADWDDGAPPAGGAQAVAAAGGR